MRSAVDDAGSVRSEDCVRAYLVKWLILVGVVVGVLLFLGYPFAGMMYEFQTVVPACLKAGYSGGRLAGNWDAYCSKRVNGTDVVVPLSHAVESAAR